MMQFTGFIRKVFATKILLPGKFSPFLTLPTILAVEGHVPPDQVSQNGNSESAFFLGHPVYNFLVTSLGILMLQPLLATPAEKSWMEEVS